MKPVLEQYRDYLATEWVKWGGNCQSREEFIDKRIDEIARNNSDYSMLVSFIFQKLQEQEPRP